MEVGSRMEVREPQEGVKKEQPSIKKFRKTSNSSIWHSKNKSIAKRSKKNYKLMFSNVLRKFDLTLTEHYMSEKYSAEHKNIRYFPCVVIYI